MCAVTYHYEFQTSRMTAQRLGAAAIHWLRGWLLHLHRCFGLDPRTLAPRLPGELITQLCLCTDDGSDVNPTQGRSRKLAFVDWICIILLFVKLLIDRAHVMLIIGSPSLPSRYRLNRLTLGSMRPHVYVIHVCSLQCFRSDMRSTPFQSEKMMKHQRYIVILMQFLSISI